MNWTEAAELLQQYLEEAARIVDGESLNELPEPPTLDVDGLPDPATETRIRSMLADAEEAMAALAIRKAEIAEEIAHMRRLKTAGTGYLRNAG
jgi:hypothetical protein